MNPAADARPTGARPDAPSLGYGSQPEPHAAFAAMIARMDRDVGRLLDVLRERHLERRTLVLFVSDNGPPSEGGGDPVFLKKKIEMYLRTARSESERWPATTPR